MRAYRNLLVLFAAPALVLAGCSSGPDQPDTVAGQFADALNRDDVAAAAALTDDPDKVSDALGKLYDGLGKDVKFDVRGVDKNSFTLAAAKMQRLNCPCDHSLISASTSCPSSTSDCCQPT